MTHSFPEDRLHRQVGCFTVGIRDSSDLKEVKKHMKTTKAFAVALAVLGIVLLTGGREKIGAQVVQEFMVEGGTGKVDFEEGYIYAKAVGTADMSKMVNEVQAEQVAKTTARHLAYGVLSETINNMSVHSAATYRQGLGVDDRLIVETKGVIQNAQVWSEEFSWTPRGAPKAVVTLRVPLYGGLSKVVAPWMKKQEAEAPPKPRFTGVGQPSEQMFTGLILDAGGKGVKPVMVPRVLTSDGQKEVYGPSVADTEQAMRLGFAGYARSQDRAKQNERVGSNPLVVKAQRADGAQGGDIVISEEDALKGLAAETKGKFLKDCKGVIVVN